MEPKAGGGHQRYQRYHPDVRSTGGGDADALIADAGGTGEAIEAYYGINFTVGQSAVGAAYSTNYGGCLGYWCGEFEYRIFLPLVLRAYSPS